MQVLSKTIAGVAVAGVMLVGATVPSAARDWTGFYIGGHVGGAWTDAQWDDISLTAERVVFDGSGVIGGAHAGYLHQFNNVVVGVEVSYSGLNVDETVRSAVVPATVAYSSQVDDLFTATARLGVASGNWLFYAKGGFASADIEYRGAEATIPDSFTNSKRSSGWVVGGGVEWLITSNVMLGIEYLHVSLDGETLTGQTAAGIPYTLTGADLEMSSVTARLSYKFGGHDRYAPLK